MAQNLSSLQVWTTQINEFRNTPGIPVWQPRFHDRIIRNAAEYRRICRYIENNTLNRNKDQFHKRQKDKAKEKFTK